ncbi:hypothetical protein EDC96DRAFT_487548 [Choanephora cucurbitarum]|nr:hypothetical protein EDC96DRAFT_487548 [Choanephora cucurbitarum]
MPTAVRPQLPLKSSFSTVTLKAPVKHEVKAASRIESAKVISFEKRQDQKIWYTIRIQPEKKVKAYLVGRKYEDFVQLSQKLYDMSKGCTGSPLPPKIKSRINILPVTKQLHAQRVDELNHFLSSLLQKQHSVLVESFVIFEFFGIYKTDLFDLNGSRWKRLRCTSFLAKSVPANVTATHLSSLCSQAANKIMPSWSRSHHASASPRPSLSTPITRDASSKTSSPSSLKSTIKIKVIYNADNIVVIQVPRSITLNGLRVRIQQKFSDTTMGDILLEKEMKLVYSDNSSSWSSMASNKPNETNASAVVFDNEEDLIQIMQAKWNRLEKVTLRCIV